MMLKRGRSLVVFVMLIGIGLTAKGQKDTLDRSIPPPQPPPDVPVGSQIDSLIPHFISRSYMESLGLTLRYDAEGVRTWSSGDEKAEIARVMEIRLAFATTEGALRYFDGNLERYVEGETRYPYPDRYRLDVKKLHVYREPVPYANSSASFGKKNVEWHFLFVLEKVMVTVKVVGWNTPFEKARVIADKAAQATASAQKTLYHASYIPVCSIPDNFSLLLKRAKVKYDAPPGYFPANVKEDPYVKYQYAVAHPSGESEIRYYIQPFDTGAKILNESLAYGLFQTEVRNIRGVAEKDLPPISEIKEEKLAKNYHADKGWISYIDAKSEFAHGYLYCMITCLYKKDVGMVYIMHLAKDKKWFAAEPQITPFTVRFSN